MVGGTSAGRPGTGRQQQAMAFERLRQLSEAHERLKHRIHNFRMPIRNKRTLFFVKCLYGTVPIVLGYGVMQLVAPDQKALEEKLRAMEARDPEGFAQARQVAEANRRQLQEVCFPSQLRVLASYPLLTHAYALDAPQVLRKAEQAAERARATQQ